MTIIVYHKRNPTFRADSTVKHTLEDYTPVAIVTPPVITLDDAYRLTNHIDQRWWENEHVECLVFRRARSTSVGDVLLVDGDYWLVMDVGFAKVRMNVEVV